MGNERARAVRRDSIVCDVVSADVPTGDNNLAFSLRNHSKIHTALLIIGYTCKHDEDWQLTRGSLALTVHFACSDTIYVTDTTRSDAHTAPRLCTGRPKRTATSSLVTLSVASVS
jgi:hypothetical protein